MADNELISSTSSEVPHLDVQHPFALDEPLLQLLFQLFEVVLDLGALSDLEGVRAVGHDEGQQVSVRVVGDQVGRGQVKRTDFWTESVKEQLKKLNPASFQNKRHNIKYHHPISNLVLNPLDPTNLHQVHGISRCMYLT